MSTSPTRTASKPACASAGHVGSRLHAGLGDLQYACRNLTGHTHGPSPVHLEGVQVALVHPYERRPCLEGPLELNLIMHLDDSGHAELSGDPVQPRQLFVVQTAQR